MDYHISMFMDHELGLDEKIEFVKKIHKDEEFYNRTLELMRQEKVIRSDPVEVIPSVRLREKRRWFSIPVFKAPWAFASSGAVVALVLLLIFSFRGTPPASVHQRFVIYKPEVNKVEISGSFTDWKLLPLKRIGSSGYWQIELDIPQGEHRYTYILEERERVADPTILTREQDDFGGENSILFAEA